LSCKWEPPLGENLGSGKIGTRVARMKSAAGDASPPGANGFRSAAHLPQRDCSCSHETIPSNATDNAEERYRAEATLRCHAPVEQSGWIASHPDGAATRRKSFKGDFIPLKNFDAFPDRTSALWDPVGTVGPR
jgi:hypothetical protein